MIIIDMWEQRFTPSHRGLTSVRSMFAYGLAALIVTLLWVTLTPQNTFAADLTWSGDAPSYNGNTYEGPVESRVIEDLGLFEDTTAYTYVEPESTTDRKIHVIYFAPGVDPGASEQANYRTYDYNGPEDYTNGSDRETLESEGQAGVSEGASSCQVDGGLGWIICPLTNTLAWFMDVIFDLLAGFLEVQPAQIGQENALYRTWSFMRTFANIAFVIAFLFIIYSQITNLGISNYGIKKLLPRIIIAAILMNLSYIICSLAVDISNLLGHSLQGLFITIRNSIVGMEGNSWNLVSWESVSTFVLSGGALGAGASIAVGSAIVAGGGTAGAALAILLPALVTVLFAVLVALLIMAARQAIITILVVLSPLAFVAFLLPNTEKWFDKWRGLFMTMLLLFPAFSVIFGGSQLAGAVIIQNATSINVVILGMLVQAAPLYVTPLLIKLSGSVLGRIAGLVNNPNRGIIDRTRNFAKDRTENMKAKNLATPAKGWQRGKRAAQRYDHNRRRREGWRNVNNAQADAIWAQSEDFQKTDAANRDATREKQLGESDSEAAYLNRLRQEGGSAFERELKLRVTVDEVTLEKGKIDKIHEELRTGKGPAGASEVLRSIATRSGEVSRDIAVTSIAAQAAKRLQNNKLSADLLTNTSRIDGQLLQDYAASIDPDGAKSAVAFASSQQHDADVKLVNERAQIMRQFELDGSERQALAMGKRSVHKTIKDENGNVKYQFTFDKSDTYAQEAAQDMQLGGQGNVENILEIVSASGSSLSGFKKDIAAAIPKNGLPGKAAFTSGVFIDKVLKGEIKSMDDIHKSIVNTYIAGGKFKEEQLAQNDAYAIKMMKEAVKKTPRSMRTVEQQANFNEMAASVNKILSDNRLRSYTTKASRDEFAGLLRNLDADPTPPPPPPPPQNT